ncbi:GNAT family N-acetyltransferase [Tychonema sp. LEGE 06208]|uniref:GNAT family N-acetyltransferase n=1 Tax=Microcoleaceae TaxID=1892252 RepID=UPI001883106F|nr:GNAT family N-acetyltransferase [Tychonema sp. LEGE 06208]
MNPSFFSSPSHEQQTPRLSAFSIRVAVSNDLTQLADVLAVSFHSRQGLVEWVYPVLRLGIYEDLKNRLRSKAEHYICLVAELVSREEGMQNYRSPRLGSVAGTIEMALRARFPWQIPSSDYPYLSNLAVHPEYRRQGVAQQLLSNCEDTAREWGFSEIYLHVLENNHAARQLYYQAGYRLQQVDWHWTHWLFGQPRRLFLRKQISLSQANYLKR